MGGGEVVGSVFCEGTATAEVYTLALHDALTMSAKGGAAIRGTAIGGAAIGGPAIGRPATEAPEQRGQAIGG